MRIEIESALTRQIPVIPLLVRGASIPPPEQLPQSLQVLSYRHGLAVRSGADFHNDMNRLIAYLTQNIRGFSEPQPKSTNQTRPIRKEKKRAQPVQEKAKPSGPPAPVDMVKVPKGPFLYGDEKTPVTIDHDYWNDTYPVTNEKYRAFVEAGGYGNQTCWSSEDWKWKTESEVTGPAHWNDEEWNKADHPVVGVSYYEAESYAKWAGKRLPTEQEWEKAARGEDGRQYPWGEEFDKARCNSNESGIGQTTPVTQYLNGVSPYGCYDMAGNVWEWCADWYDKNGGERVSRGGSWTYAPGTLCASTRFRVHPRHPERRRRLPPCPGHFLTLCPLFFDPFRPISGSFRWSGNGLTDGMGV